MITPGELLDTSIAQLQTLVAFLGDQLGDRNGRPEPATLEARACEEILLSLSVLIPKLEAARHTTPGAGASWGRRIGRFARSAGCSAPRARVSRLLPLSSKLTEETPVIGPHPLLDEPTLIVKPEDVHQVPEYTLGR
jgi:hypothetical protein